MSEIVRREGWHSCSDAGARERRSEPFRRELLEHSAVRVPIVTRAEFEHAIEQEGGRTHPTRPSCLGNRHRDAPAAAQFVNIAPREPLKFADAHPGRVEGECRQPVALRQKVQNGLDVLSHWRLDVSALLSRQANRLLIAGRVRLDVSVIENHGAARRLSYESSVS